MSDHTFPVVSDGQQTDPDDFNTAVDRIKDAPAQLARHALVDPGSWADQGVILWGLEVTDDSEPGTPRVQVAPGAALLPAAAGDAAWRIAILSASATLAVPVDAGGRTDAIQLGLTEDPADEEDRVVRTVQPGGVITTGLEPVTVTMRPRGVAARLEGVDPATPAAAPGTVLLATVTVDGAGITAVGDQRAFALPGAAGASDVSGGGTHFRGAFTALRSLMERLVGVIAAQGGLGVATGGDWDEHLVRLGYQAAEATGAVRLATQTDTAAGLGAGVPVFDFQALNVRASTGVALLPQTRIAQTTLVSDAIDYAPGSYGDDPDGLRLNIAKVPRAVCTVIAAGAATWRGQNIVAVTRHGVGDYSIEFAASVFPNNTQAYGELDGGRYAPQVILLAGADDQPMAPRTYLGANNKTIRIKLWRWAGNNFLVNDQPFRVILWGPYDAPAEAAV